MFYNGSKLKSIQKWHTVDGDIYMFWNNQMWHLFFIGSVWAKVISIKGYFFRVTIFHVVHENKQRYSHD